MELLDKLNEQQKLPVLQTEGAVLVSAGAGSGKTRVLTSRIAYLISECGVSPYNILAITFTNKAANEMRKRVSLYAENGENVFISTFHAFCVRVLRENVEKLQLGLTKNFTIYADNEKEKIAKEAIKNIECDDENFFKEVLKQVGYFKNGNVSLEEFVSKYTGNCGAENLKTAITNYNNLLIKNNALDFDDILQHCLKLFRENADVLDSYQERFKYIHIDEFQDTNKVQYDIVKLLAKKYGNIMIVGDEDQCIYGWRGASIENITNFYKDFPNYKLFKLEQNYRSSKKIIKCANQIIKKNTMRTEKTLFTENEEGVEVTYKETDSETYEADYVVQNILRLVKLGKYKYSDFAILMRLNAFSRPFEERLMTYNVPYKLYGGFKFFERAEVKGVLAYLRLIANPYDGEALSRLLSFPKCGIGEVSINAFKECALNNNQSLLDLLKKVSNSSLIANLKNKFLKLSELYANIQQNWNLYQLADYIVKNSGILDMFSEESEENKNKILNINNLLNSIAEYVSLDSSITVEKYLEMVTLSNDIDTMNEEDNNVALATIHAVKGLEFKVVFVVGLEDKSFPLERCAGNSLKESEEERRLMYVAITRAEKELFLTRAKCRFMYGKRNYTVPSIFVGELGFGNSYANYQNYSNDYTGYSYSMCQPESKEEKIKNLFNSTRSEQKTINKLGTGKEHKDYSRFVLGAKVTHPKFGEGVIVDNSEINITKCVKIDFDEYGIKNLIVDFAPIEIL